MRLHEQTLDAWSPLKRALLGQLEIMGKMRNAARGPFGGRKPWDHWEAARNNETIRKLLQPHIEARMKSGAPSNQKKTVVDLAIKHVEQDNPKASAQQLDPNFIEVLMSNLKAFLFAGHDTTASTICFMVKLLQDNPECLAKLRAEHDKVIGPDPEKAPEVLAASPHLLYSLTYTQGVIKETLRLYPLAATMRAGEPNFFVTAHNSSIRYPLTDDWAPWLSAPGIQHHPDFWPRPSEFVPERWTVPEGDPLHPFKDAWTPFSLGSFYTQ
jgi:cytochrome P450